MAGIIKPYHTCDMTSVTSGYVALLNTPYYLTIILYIETTLMVFAVAKLHFKK